MSTISSVSPSASLDFINDQTTGTVRVPKKSLGQEDFLQLLAMQFKTQDPMKPMEDTAFIAQMAQFTSLDQTSQMRKDQQMLTSTGYLGRTVTVQDPFGELHTGLVSAVDNTGSSPALVIDGLGYSLSSVKRIEPTPLPTTLPANPPAA